MQLSRGSICVISSAAASTSLKYVCEQRMLRRGCAAGLYQNFINWLFEQVYFSNREDPDEMSQNVTFHQGLLCK